jgi:hypothetical protein
MAFPQEHIYLTVHWDVQGASGETGQFGLRFAEIDDATQAMVNGCASAVSTMWTSSGAGIENGYLLRFLRVAQIGTDGKYVPGTISYDYTYTSPPAGGGGTTTARFPLQTALCTTLVTAMPRGQASKGRIYLPWTNNALGSDHKWTTTVANSRSAAIATMITALNTAIGGPCTVMSKGTKAAPTIGAQNFVTGVKTGTRPDVQRRRAKQITEVYGTTSTVT